MRGPFCGRAVRGSGCSEVWDPEMSQRLWCSQAADKGRRMASGRPIQRRAPMEKEADKRSNALERSADPRKRGPGSASRRRLGRFL